ncbi:hyaluronidase-4-like isoform X1 [Acipenser ruthenus]|uniref:hyaluronidase-4-like isoform X1 n=1 Tax=Acipenser ruthenus TaxID=7906 RepID=UPI0027417F56|nr:hyaluronidase-4-like isoform X1 [Acipenser ruthenus]XP_033881566.2 hyaluronidase-4-like isoform X1 [Acipenser ruthenus]
MDNMMRKVTPNHAVPLTCILNCTWMLVLISSSFALKPAKTPVIGKKPFIAAWNAPIDLCTTKYNISVNLKMFHINGSPRASLTGQNVTIFYANRLGYYPFYTEQGLPVNGGIPQNCSLETHLLKADEDIKFYIPSADFSGLAIIDWEYWRPQWKRNWYKKDIYKRKSRELISKAYINVTAEQIEHLAQDRFERSAMAFMKQTVELGIQNRPKGLWGYYLYPDCHNYNLHEENYTGSCPVLESLRNDELFWLWNSSTALFPSVAIKKSHADSINNLHFSKFRVLESMRIASMTSMDYDLPTFVYTRLGYRDDPLSFLSTQDLIYTIGESAALGAAGFVIWGDLNLTSSRHNCSKVKLFMSYELGLYITNVTKAAEVCSEFLCQNNGRCVRKDWQALHYLHLNPNSYMIQPSEEGEFIVTGQASSEELSDLREKFSCHCYQGHGGQKCDILDKPGKPDSSTSKPFNSVVTVFLLSVVNLIV